MSWLVLNIVLAFELLIVVLMSRYAQQMFVVIRSIREWILPLPEEMTDIRDELNTILDRVQSDVPPMLRNFRFIGVTAGIAVWCNMATLEIVWLPFWASVGFAAESFMHLYRLEILGQFLNRQTAAAEYEVIRRLNDESIASNDITNNS